MGTEGNKRADYKKKWHGGWLGLGKDSGEIERGKMKLMGQYGFIYQ